MGPDDITSTLCPCCEQELYRSVVREYGVVGSLKGSPEIEHDARGHFMICHHCQKRIAFETRLGGPSGVAYHLSTKQECR